MDLMINEYLTESDKKEFKQLLIKYDGPYFKLNFKKIIKNTDNENIKKLLNDIILIGKPCDFNPIYDYFKII